MIHLIDLRPKWPAHHRETVRYRKRGRPFFWNHRGLLIHRVRAICEHLDGNGNVTHSTIDYWCGNVGRECRGQYFEKPPTDRLLCVHCEQRAAAAGEPTASDLAGRHVCIGRLKVHRLCCHGERN